MAIIYVDINSSSGGDGTSWGTSYNDLELALSTANPGDEIWVARGTYIVSQGYDVGTGLPSITPRTQTFKIPSSVKVFGGFFGNETLLSQRDFKTYETTLSGDLAGINAFHVVYFLNVNSNTELDGFTIIEGNANLSPVNNLGGGMYNSADLLGNSDPIIRNCNFIGNQANIGAGVSNNAVLGASSASPQFINCVFSQNTATGNAGAFYSAAATNTTCSPYFENCLFSDNTAPNGQGGAIYNSSSGSSSPTFMNVTFYNNKASTAGIISSLGSANITMTNCILWDTTSLDIISLNVGSTLTVTYSTVIGGFSGVGNTDLYPLFTNELNLIGPDNIWATNDDGLTLQLGSPALYTGTQISAPLTDIIGNSSVPSSMGCYGLGPPTTTTTSTTTSTTSTTTSTTIEPLVIYTIFPTIGPTTGGTTVTITGSGFIPDLTTVTIGGITVAALVDDTNTSLTFVTPPHFAGYYSITITTPYGTTTILRAFLFIQCIPTTSCCCKCQHQYHHQCQYQCQCQYHYHQYQYPRQYQYLYQRNCR